MKHKCLCIAVVETILKDKRFTSTVIQIIKMLENFYRKKKNHNFFTRFVYRLVGF